MKSTGRTIGRIALIAAALLTSAGVPAAQVTEEPEETFNYAYSTWLGTGVYRFGERHIYVLRGNFSYSLQEPADDKWGWSCCCLQLSA